MWSIWKHQITLAAVVAAANNKHKLIFFHSSLYLFRGRFRARMKISLLLAVKSINQMLESSSVAFLDELYELFLHYSCRSLHLPSQQNAKCMFGLFHLIFASPNLLLLTRHEFVRCWRKTRRVKPTTMPMNKIDECLNVQRKL